MMTEPPLFAFLPYFFLAQMSQTNDLKKNLLTYMKKSVKAFVFLAFVLDHDSLLTTKSY